MWLGVMSACVRNSDVHVPVNYFINLENNFLGLYLIIRFELFKSQCPVNSVTGFLKFNYGIYTIYYFLCC